MDFLLYGVLPSLFLLACKTTKNRLPLVAYLLMAFIMIGPDFSGLGLWVFCQATCWLVVGFLYLVLG